MADESWRTYERRWQADPGDQDALHRAIAARRRAGVPVSGWMLEQCEFPPRTFDSPLRLDVFVMTLDGRPQGVGRTPAGGDGVQLPPHRTWWVQPDASVALQDLADQIHAAEIPGLSAAPGVRDDDLAHLAGLPLQRLDLGGCSRIGPGGMGHVGALRHLTYLNLWYCRGVNDAALANLAGLDELTTLNLSHCTKVTSAGMTSLSGLRQLGALSCQGLVEVGDAGLDPLIGLPRLAVLDLQRCAITDVGLTRLVGLSELTLLNVSFCLRLSHDGLRALAELERLTHVYALGCGLDSNAVASIQRTALPRVEILT